jgi:2-polyprenyl-3-methyl-5-hydroxy-6-metoxy-1,4-benzoquinol methylase
MIGEDIRKSVFRDTKTFYDRVPIDQVARQLIVFARKHAGKEILDLGCAVGNYSRRLAALGYRVKGADINPEYIRIARERGVDAYLVEGGALPFPDRSFDSVVLFEVLEHLPDPDGVLREAKRVARKNVILTTPNSERTADLQRAGLLYEHFADLDHRNFFTPATLEALLEKHFRKVRVRQGDGINPLALLPWKPLRVLGAGLTHLGLLKPRFYFRLFAVADV